MPEDKDQLVELDLQDHKDHKVPVEQVVRKGQPEQMAPKVCLATMEHLDVVGVPDFQDLQAKMV